MILVDTCVWIENIRDPQVGLLELIEDEEVVTHEFITGELACGHLARRREVLDLMSFLPVVDTATTDEILHFIDAHSLAGSGLNFVDMHLLATTKLDPGVSLWTFDRRLRKEVERLSASNFLH